MDSNSGMHKAKATSCYTKLYRVIYIQWSWFGWERWDSQKLSQSSSPKQTYRKKQPSLCKTGEERAWHSAWKVNTRLQQNGLPGNVPASGTQKSAWRSRLYTGCWWRDTGSSGSCAPLQREEKSGKLTDATSPALSPIYPKPRHRVMESTPTHTQTSAPPCHCAITHAMLADQLHYYLSYIGQSSLPSHTLLLGEVVPYCPWIPASMDPSASVDRDYRPLPPCTAIF